MTPVRDRFSGSLPRWVQGGASLSPRYLVALAAFGAAILFRYALDDSLGQKVPYLQLYPAVMIAAWYGGLGPGLLITALSTIAAMYFLLPPYGLAVERLGRPAFAGRVRGHRHW